MYSIHITSYHTHNIHIYINYIYIILPLCLHLWKYAIDWKHIHQLSMANIWGTWTAWLFLLPSWHSPFGFVGMQPCGHRLPWYNFAHGRPTEERRLVFLGVGVWNGKWNWNRLLLKRMRMIDDIISIYHSKTWFLKIAICMLHPYTFKMYCCMFLDVAGSFASAFAAATGQCAKDLVHLRGARRLRFVSLTFRHA